jgi:hypothetical protein
MYEDKFNYYTRKYLFQTEKVVIKGNVPLKSMYNFINVRPREPRTVN